VLLAPGNRWAKEIIARRLGQKKESVAMRLLSSSGGERQQKGLSERAADWDLPVSPEGIWTGGQQQSAATLCYKAAKWSRDAMPAINFTFLFNSSPTFLFNNILLLTYIHY
jgi:hypothetical protein